MPLDPAVPRFGLFSAFVGFLAGLIYGLGGLVVDAATTGLNVGSALALLAILGMPLLFGLVGTLAALLWLPFYHRIPMRYGGARPQSAP